MELLSSLMVAVISSALGYMVGKARDRKQMLFDKKLKIYSEVISNISDSNYLKNLNTSDLVKTLAPARFLADKNTSNRLRDYFDFAKEYIELANLKTKKDLTINEVQEKVESAKTLGNKISECIMELEQLMRVELGQKRVLSKKEIRHHIAQKPSL